MAAEKPQWIWNAEKAKDGERVFFRLLFDFCYWRSFRCYSSFCCILDFSIQRFSSLIRHFLAWISLNFKLCYGVTNFDSVTFSNQILNQLTLVRAWYIHGGLVSF